MVAIASESLVLVILVNRLLASPDNFPIGGSKQITMCPFARYVTR